MSNHVNADNNGWIRESSGTNTKAEAKLMAAEATPQVITIFIIVIKLKTPKLIYAGCRES